MICEPTFVSPKCFIRQRSRQAYDQLAAATAAQTKTFRLAAEMDRLAACAPPIISFDQSFFFAVGGASSGLEGSELSLYTNGTWSGVMIRAMSRTMTLATPSTGSLAW